MKVALIPLFTLLLVLPLAAAAQRVCRAKGPSGPPPAYLEVARRAVRDGDLPLAVRALQAARACWRRHRRACGFTRDAFEAVRGVVALEHGDLAQATAALRAAVRLAPHNEGAWFYLGQACFRAGRFSEAAGALSRADGVGRKLPSYHTMLARAHHRAGQPERARKALALGLSRFPGRPDLLQEASLLYVKQGLFAAALALGRRAVARGGPALAHLMVADQESAAGHHRRVLAVLEEARLLRPDDGRVQQRLAHAYARAGLPAAAAPLLDRLARHRPELAHAAAEQYRAAGLTRRALRANARVPDRHKQALQRAEIHLQDGAFDLALVRLLPLWRAGKLAPAACYRLAYAALKTARPDLAAKALDSLKGTTLAGRARALRAALRRCRSRPWECL